MCVSKDQLEDLSLAHAPPPDSAWISFDQELKRMGPPPQFNSILERQQTYAEKCRSLYRQMTSHGARDHHLDQGIERTEFTIPSRADGFPIPVLQLEMGKFKGQEPAILLFYYHGGGLVVGEADSEELSCRRIVKKTHRHLRLYSVGYRLMPEYSAQTCVSDSLDVFNELHIKNGMNIVVGSSSGGQLAATVAQMAPRGSLHGLLLRCPVTADPVDEKRYIPEKLRPFHTSFNPDFFSSIFQDLKRDELRDGLDTLPIEASKEQLIDHPRTWVQLCTNDTLYSDGLCYAMALVDAGVQVRVDVRQGWPHTFWLKAPHLPQALEAEDVMLEGLHWILK